MNRLLDSVRRYEVRIADRLARGSTSMKELSFLALADSAAELVQYQQAQSRAFAYNRLTSDEAFWLYTQLGGEMPTREKFNSLPVAVRIVVLQSMKELLMAESIAELKSNV